MGQGSSSSVISTTPSSRNTDLQVFVSPSPGRASTVAALQQWTLDDVQQLLRDFRKLGLGFGAIGSQFKSWVCATVAGSKISEDWADTLFEALDTDHNGRVDCLEFLSSAAILCRGPMQDKVRFAFELYDLNSNGSLSPFEATLMMKSTLAGVHKLFDRTSPGGNDEIEDLARQAFRVYDKDKNARLSFGEFFNWIGGFKPIVDFLDQFGSESASNNQQPLASSASAMLPYSTGPYSTNSDLGWGPNDVRGHVLGRPLMSHAVSDENSKELRKMAAEDCEPTRWKQPLNHTDAPAQSLQLQWIYGAPSMRNSLVYISVNMTQRSDGKETTQAVFLIVYPVGEVVVILNSDSQTYYQGHRGRVSIITAHPNQQLVASASLENNQAMVHIWAPASLEETVVTLPVCHGLSASSLKFSPDGNLLAIAGDEPGQGVQVWNWRMRSQILSIGVGESVVSDIEWFADRRAIAICGPGLCSIVHVEEQVALSTANALSGTRAFTPANFATIPVTAVSVWCTEFTSVARLGTNVVFGNTNGDLLRVDDQGTEQGGVMEAHSHGQRVNVLGEWAGGLMSGGQDGCVYFWDMKLVLVRKVHLGTIGDASRGLDGGIASLCADPSNAAVLISTKSSGVFRLLYQKSKLTCEVDGHSAQGIQSMAAHPTRAIFASSDSSQATLRIWDMNKHKQIKKYDIQSTCLSFSHDGSFLAVGVHRGTIAIIDCTSFVLIARFSLWDVWASEYASVGPSEHSSSSQDAAIVAFSPSGRLLAVGGCNGSVCVFACTGPDTDPNFECIAICIKGRGHHGTVHALDWSADDSFLRSVDTAESISVWNCQGNPISRKALLRDIVWQDSSCLGTWGNQGLVEKLAADKDNAAMCVRSPMEASKRDKVSPVISVGTENGVVALARYPSVKCDDVHLKQYRAHSTAVASVQFAEVGRSLLSASRNESCIAQWRVVSLESEIYETQKTTTVLQYDSEIDEELNCFNPQPLDQKQAMLSEDNTTLHTLLNDGPYGHHVQVGDVNDSLNNNMADASNAAGKDEELFVTWAHNRHGIGGSNWGGGGVGTARSARPHDLKLEWSQGFSARHVRDGVRYLGNGAQILFSVGPVCVLQDLPRAGMSSHLQQLFLNKHNNRPIRCLDVRCGHSHNLVALGEVCGTEEYANVVVASLAPMAMRARLECPWKGGVVKVQFSPNGDYIVAAGADKRHSLAMFEWESGRLVASAEMGVDATVLGIAWLESNRFLVVGSKGVVSWLCVGSMLEPTCWSVPRSAKVSVCHTCIGMLHTKDRTRVQSGNGPSGTTGAVKWSGYVVTGTMDGSLCFWNGHEQTFIVTQASWHAGAVTCLHVTADSEELLTGGSDGLIKGWSLESLVEALGLGDNLEQVRKGELKDLNEGLEAGQTISGSNEDLNQTFLDSNLSRNESKHSDASSAMGITRASIRSIHSKPDSINGLKVVVGLRNNLILELAHSTSADSWTQPVHSVSPQILQGGHGSTAPIGIAAHPSLNIVATVGGDFKLRLWDLEARTEIEQITLPGKAESVTFKPDASELMVGLTDGQVVVYAKESEFEAFSKHNPGMGMSTPSRNNSAPPSIFGPTPAYVFKDWETNRGDGRATATVSSICVLSHAPGNTLLLAAGTHSGDVVVFRTSDRGVAFVLRGTGSQVMAIDWSKEDEHVNRQYLRVRSADGKLVLWNVTNGVRVAHAGAAVRKQWVTWTCCASNQTKCSVSQLANGGTTVAVGAPGGLLCLRTVGPRPGNTSQKNSNISRYQASQTDDSSNDPTFEGHSSQVTGLVFTWDDRYLVTVSQRDGSLMVWSTVGLSNLARARAEWNNLSTEQRLSFGSRFTTPPSELDGVSRTSSSSMLPCQSPPRDSLLRAFKSCFSSQLEQSIDTKDLEIPQGARLDWVYGFRSNGAGAKIIALPSGGVLFAGGRMVVAQQDVSLSRRGAVSTQRMYQGHSSQVVAFAVDRRRGVCVSAEEIAGSPLHVWDLATMTLLRTIALGNLNLEETIGSGYILKDQHIAPHVALVAVSPCSLYICCVFTDASSTIAVYSALDCTLLCRSGTGMCTATSIQVVTSATGILQVCVCGENGLGLWFVDVMTKQMTCERGTFKDTGLTANTWASSVITALALGARGGNTFLLTGQLDGKLSVWSGGFQNDPISAHQGPVLALATLDAKTMAAACTLGNGTNSNTISTPTSTWMGNPGGVGVNGRGYGEASAGFVSGGTDGKLHIWDNELQLRTTLAIFSGRYGVGDMLLPVPEIRGIEVCEATGSIVVALSSGSIVECKLPWGKDDAVKWRAVNDGHNYRDEPFKQTSHVAGAFGLLVQPPDFLTVALRPSTSISYTVGSNGVVQAWNLERRSLTGSMQVNGASNALALHPHRHIVAVGTRFGKLVLLAGDLDHCLGKPRSCGKDELTCLAFSQNGNLLAAGCADTNTYVLETRHYTVVQVVAGKRGAHAVSSLEWDKKSSRLTVTDAKRQSTTEDVAWTQQSSWMNDENDMAQGDGDVGQEFGNQSNGQVVRHGIKIQGGGIMLMYSMAT